MDEIPISIVQECGHEAIGDRHAHVEVTEPTFALGVDEFLHIRMVAAKHGHLCATACAGGFNGLARLIEDLHVRQRAAGAALRTFHPRTLGSNAREVVADSPTAPHRFRGLIEGIIDANLSVDARNTVTDRLYEAVDQGGLEVRSGGGIDAAARDEALHLRTIEGMRPLFARVRLLD